MSNPSCSNLSLLEKKLQYVFSDSSLLVLALKHKSAGKPNNERLEFLGDAILNAVVAEALFLQDATMPEGKMTTARAQLVRGETLTQIAKELGIDDLVELGLGERKHGLEVRQSILEDAIEAIIGAVFLDSDFPRVKDVVLALMNEKMAKLVLSETHKDAKTELQELMQAQQAGLPKYVLLKVDGPPHQREFTIECRTTVTSIVALGEGQSRRTAEQQAASNMLKEIKNLRLNINE